MKRVFAIHDISGIGKCSLTVALPIISCCGIECNPIPTAVLSTHTGNINGYTFRDLSDDIKGYYGHWLKLGIKPDGIYSGYIASEKQIEEIISLIDDFSDYSPLIVVDPAMADSGILYKGFDYSFAQKMTELCKKADIITPNITEALLLSGLDYGQPQKEITDEVIQKLSLLTGRYFIITGTESNGKIGCFVYDKSCNIGKSFFGTKYPGTYYGTGDIFTSVLTGLILNGFDIFSAAEYATGFISKAIKETFENGTDTRFGIAFENQLSDLTTKVEEFKNELR